MNSGSTSMPPRMLKRPALGIVERRPESPDSASTASGSTIDQAERRPRAPAPAGRSRICRRLRPDRDRRSRRRCRAASAISAQRDARLEHRLRQEQAAVVEEAAARNGKALAHAGQRLEHGVVPEQQLQQQRHVADDLDIEAGHPRHQPVLRQPRDADQKAEDGREHDAERRDQQRVEQADPERAAIGRGRRIVDQRLADVEAGGVVPEAEAGGDLGARQIVGGVVDRAPGQEHDHRAQHHLIGDAADLRIVEQRRLRSACVPRPSAIGACPSGRSRAAQRTGGANCRPPLFHSAFRPRAIFSGEPCPTLRSNASP